MKLILKKENIAVLSAATDMDQGMVNPDNL
jgi:hypothetical protein